MLIISSPQSKNAPDRNFVKIEFLIATCTYHDLSGKKSTSWKSHIYPLFWEVKFAADIIGTFFPSKKALSQADVVMAGKFW